MGLLQLWCPSGSPHHILPLFNPLASFNSVFMKSHFSTEDKQTQIITLRKTRLKSVVIQKAEERDRGTMGHLGDREAI